MSSSVAASDIARGIGCFGATAPSSCSHFDGNAYHPYVATVRGDLLADLRHMTAAWDATSAGIIRLALPRFVLQPRFRAIVYFRLSQWAWSRPSTRFIAHWLQGRTIRCSGAEIHPAARIGAGLSIAHSVGIVVGHDVVAGADLVLHQGVTLGHRGRVHDGQPTLGDRVRIGAGANVLGRIVVGDDVLIGANAVVLADVPPGTTVKGLWDRHST